jgi:hypothetical protein
MIKGRTDIRKEYKGMGGRCWGGRDVVEEEG